ncbi:MAG: GNAT family N-acetyltransferase [Actinomycetia bacterium]|nr:GNAT family N-acetyltransferase [Actinomycetes bacterium]
MHDERVGRFLERLEEVDGTFPLSDAKLAQIKNSERTVVIEEDGSVVAVGVVAEHPQLDGSRHWSVETALDPGLRFVQFENRLLSSALGLVPGGKQVSVWSQRHSLDHALADTGFVVVRELAYMTVQLPIDSTCGDRVTRMLRSSDTDSILAINRAAFSSHREAASLDSGEFTDLLDQPGLGPEGFLVMEDDNEILGFCWTRVNATRDGEIFRVAVSPHVQGQGLGRALVIAGFNHLATEPDVTRGTLWVDLSNTAAVNLYRDLGMVDTLINREFERPIF